MPVFELPGKEIVKLGERLVEGVPGFAWAAILLNILVGFAFPKLRRELVPVWAFSLAWAGDTFGHYADDWLYDPIWSRKKRRFPATLFTAKQDLAKHWNAPVTGIFSKAGHLSAGTEIWEKRVKLWLEFSKASRSFMFLSVAVLLSKFTWVYLLVLTFFLLVVLFVKPTWTGSKYKAWTGLRYWVSGTALIGVLFKWLVPCSPYRLFGPLALIFFVSTVVYLGLRVLHIIRLYEDAKTIILRKRDGFLCVGQRVLPVRRVLLSSTDDGTDAKICKAEEFVQSRALCHVEFRAAYRPGQECQGVSCELKVCEEVEQVELNVCEELEQVDWGITEPNRVPNLGRGEWLQATLVNPDLVINFVRSPGHDLTKITKTLNATI